MTVLRSRPRASSSDAPRRWGLAFVAGALVLGLVGGPAAAQPRQEPPTTTVPDEDPPKTQEEREAAEKALLETLALAPEELPPAADDVFVEAVETKAKLQSAAFRRLDATAKADAANKVALEAAHQLDLAQDKEKLAKAVRDDAAAELSDERDRLADLMVQAYVTGGDANVDIDKYQAYLEGDTTDPDAGRQIMFTQVLDRQKQVTQVADEALRRARIELKDVRLVVKAAKAKALRLLAVAADRTDKRVRAEQAHLAAVVAAQEADQRLRTAADDPIEPIGVDVALIGLPRLSPEDLAGWFAQSPYRPRVTTPIEDYARWFIEEGRAEGIRGDVAFAQAVLETGGFANTDSVLGNNFSGIGHYDNVPLGWTFPSPRLGVRAQIQLLKSYAVKEPAYANELVDERLHGPAGCCETWGDLTTVWATDPTYGPKVMLLYTSLVDYALKRRARGEGFDDTIPQ